jgi:hypothetical protein
MTSRDEARRIAAIAKLPELLRRANIAKLPSLLRQ